MKILITGCLGHLGSYLLRNLPTGIKIVGYDNLSTQRYCSLFNLPHPIEFHDTGFENIIEDDLKDINCVIHLAAITNATNANKADIQDININKTKEFIDKCLNVVPRFIFPSSTSVYGIARDIVSEDDDTVINPQSDYAASKIEIENYIKEKYQENLGKYLILRLGTICGTSPGMRFHTAVNSFCYNAVFHKEMTIWQQNYHMFRPYLSLLDLKYVLYHLLPKQELWNNTYNVITDNIKLFDIVYWIQQQFTDSVTLKFIDTPLLNQFSYMVSNKKLANTKFYTGGSIKQDIEDTIKLLSKQLFYKF